MITKSVAEINKYVGSSVNPMATPDQIYELYSVPSFESGAPEIVSGADIGSTKVIVEEGDILICKINPRINRVWVVHHNTEHPLLASSEWIVVRNATMNSDYLKWYFSSPSFRTLLTSQVTGIGGSLTRAQPKQVAKYPVPIPSRDEQDYVADILTRIDNLMHKYQQQIIGIEQLVKSRFIELFGTIHDNRFGFGVVTLQDVSAPIKDGTHQTPTYTTDAENGYKFLSSKDVTTGKVDWSHLKYIPEELHRELYARISPRKGDILLAKNGTTGIAAIVDRDEVFDIYVSLALIRPHGVDPTYLWAAINAAETKQQFDASLKGIGVPNLHLGEIKKARIILPPMELQEQFAAFVEQTDKSKLAVQKGLQELEILKKSLMQQYFG